MPAPSAIAMRSPQKINPVAKRQNPFKIHRFKAMRTAL